MIADATQTFHDAHGYLVPGTNLAVRTRAIGSKMIVSVSNMNDARGRSSVQRRGGGNGYKPPTLLSRRGSVVDMYGVESSAGANDCVQLVHTLHLVVLGYPELCPLTPYLLESRFERKCLFNPCSNPNCTCHIVVTCNQAELTLSSAGW